MDQPSSTISKKPPATIYDQERQPDRGGRRAADAIAEAELQRCERRMVLLHSVRQALDLLMDTERSDAARLMAHLERARKTA